MKRRENVHGHDSRIYVIPPDSGVVAVHILKTFRMCGMCTRQTEGTGSDFRLVRRLSGRAAAHAGCKFVVAVAAVLVTHRSLLR